MLIHLEEEKNKVYMDEFFYAIMVLLSVFFMTSKLTPITVSIMTLLFFVIFIKRKAKVVVPKIVILFFSLIVIILLQMLIEPSQYYSVDNAIKELYRILIFTILVMVIANIKVRDIFFLSIWSIVFLGLFLISVFQYYDLFSINEILELVYWDSVHLSVSRKYSTLVNFRAGSVFINFNNYSQFLIMILSVFLVYRYQKKLSVKMFILLFIVIIFSLILAGSRTGFLVGIILILTTLLTYLLKRGVTLPIFLGTLFGMLFLLIIIIIFFNKIDLTNLRLLEVNKGLSNSLDYKYSTFLNMIREMNLLNFLIGFGPYEYKSVMIDQIDFDFGYMLTYYGLFGLVFYALFVYFHIKKRMNNGVGYSLLTILLLLVFLFTSMTSGMFFNLRIFSILLLLISTNIIVNDNDIGKMS